MKNSIEEIVNLFGSKNVIETAAEISRLMKDIGLKTSLRELGVKSDSDLKIIEENVNYERLENNPRTVTKEAVRRIIGNIL